MDGITQNGFDNPKFGANAKKKTVVKAATILRKTVKMPEEHYRESS
jgi:hypothetical protein